MISSFARKLAVTSVACAALLAACGGSTTPTSAPPQPTVAAPTAVPVQPTTAPVQPTAAPKPTTAPATVAPTAVPAQPTAAPQPTSATSAGAASLKIDSAKSLASFTLGELLFGRPNIVTGTTSNVEGSVSVAWDNLTNSKIGPIKIDARGFKTDSNMRDGQIQRFILQSNQDSFRYITFEPTGFEGLPAKSSTGQSATFKVTGNLTVRDVSKPVTFDVTVTPKSDKEIQGTATTKVLRSTFNLQIPNVPSVADVTDEVTLQFDFVATA